MVRDVEGHGGGGCRQRDGVEGGVSRPRVTQGVDRPQGRRPVVGRARRVQDVGDWLPGERRRLAGEWDRVRCDLAQVGRRVDHDASLGRTVLVGRRDRSGGDPQLLIGTRPLHDQGSQDVVLELLAGAFRELGRVQCDDHALAGQRREHGVSTRLRCPRRESDPLRDDGLAGQDHARVALDGGQAVGPAEGDLLGIGRHHDLID